MARPVDPGGPTVRDLGLATSIFIEFSMTTFETKTGACCRVLERGRDRFKGSEGTAE